MSHRYQVLADRIKQELISLEKVVNRSQRGMAEVNQNTENQDLFLDSVFLETIAQNT